MKGDLGLDGIGSGCRPVGGVVNPKPINSRSPRKAWQNWAEFSLAEGEGFEPPLGLLPSLISSWVSRSISGLLLQIP